MRPIESSGTARQTRRAEARVLTPPGRRALFALAPIDGLMLLVVLIWGSNFAIIKLALAELPPLGFNALRLVLASGLLLSLLAARGSLRPPPESRRPLFVLGLIGHCVYQICFIEGVARTSVANSSLILGCVPIAVLVLNAVSRKRENVTALHGTGVGLSAVGLYLVVGQGAAASRQTLAGDLLAMAALWCWALYTLWSRPLLTRISPLAVTAYSMGYGTLLFLPWAVPDLVRLDWAAVSPGAWLALAASATLALCVSYVIWYTAVQRIGSTRTSVYSNLVPVVAMIVAATVLHEPVTIRKIAGASAILVGLALARVGPPATDAATDALHYAE